MRSRASGRHLGRLERRAQRRDHVGLAPARDRACTARGPPGPARPAGASGRAPPRAPSCGSASRRSQASRSRTSARSKKPAPPTSRYGMPRSSSAVATSWPSLRTERTSTAVSAGSMPSAIRRSSSAATACACARSFSQRQNDTGSRPQRASGCAAARSFFVEPVLVGLDDRVGGVEDRLVRAVVGLQPQHLRRRGTPAGSRRCSCARRRGSGRSTGRRRRPRPRCGGRRPAACSSSLLGEVRVLVLVDEHRAEALGDAGGGRRAAPPAAGSRARSSRRSPSRPPRRAARSWAA